MRVGGKPGFLSRRGAGTSGESGHYTYQNWISAVRQVAEVMPPPSGTIDDVYTDK